jgi:hypothetical protein
MILTENTTCMKKIGNYSVNLDGKLEEKKALEDRNRRRKDNETDLQEVGSQVTDKFQLTHGTMRCWAIVNTVMKF